LPCPKQLVTEKLAPRFKYHVQQDGGTAKRAPESSCLKRRAAEHRDNVNKRLLLNSIKRRGYRAALLSYPKKKAGEHDYYKFYDYYKFSETKIAKETRKPPNNNCSVLETLPGRAAPRTSNTPDGDSSDSSLTSSSGSSSSSSSSSAYGILNLPMIREDKDDISVITGDTSIATYNSLLRFRLPHYRRQSNSN
jgi:hypothetical protein